MHTFCLKRQSPRSVLFSGLLGVTLLCSSCSDENGPQDTSATAQQPDALGAGGAVGQASGGAVGQASGGAVGQASGGAVGQASGGSDAQSGGAPSSGGAANPDDVENQTGGAAPDGPDPDTGPGTIITEPDDEATFVFDQAELRTYNFVVAEAELEILDADPRAEVFVSASLEFEGETYPIGMRYKGSQGAFAPPCTAGQGRKTGKCSIKASFNYDDPEGRMYGLKKLNFHSFNRDPSLLRDRLGYTMFREFGIPASRAVHARVLINGELEGIFAVVEQVDGRFTRSRFTEGGKGNLYKEIWPIHDDPEAYIASLETNKNEMPSVDKMIAFKDAINVGTAEMEAWLDRQMTINYLAIDRVMMNDDGIMHWWCVVGGQGNNPPPNGNHNYYWYEATDANRIWLVPWDLDNLFNFRDTVRVTVSWTAPPDECMCVNQRQASCDTLIRQWGTDWLPDYETAVDTLIAGPFAATNVDALLATWETQISAAVMEDPYLDYETWIADAAAMKSEVNNARINRGYSY